MRKQNEYKASTVVIIIAISILLTNIAARFDVKFGIVNNKEFQYFDATYQCKKVVK